MGKTTAGDLLFFSGLVAADAQGLIERARLDPRQPYYGSSIEAQMVYLLAVAGAACQQWHRRLPSVPLPLAAFQVPAPLLVPGCTVQRDLWVYVP